MTTAGVIRWTPWLAALVAGTLPQAGCGGERLAPAYTKIDDMEGTDGVIPFAGPEGSTPGRWFTATDCSQADRLFPPLTALNLDGWSFAPLPAPHETVPGIVSTQAVRFRTTSPIVAGWGATVGLGFAEGSTDGGVVEPPVDCAEAVEAGRYWRNIPIDLTAYRGVTFWARAESPGTRTLRVQVNDVHTDPRGGICQAEDTSASDYCYNSFGWVVDLTDTFRQYTLDFSLFTQRGSWGYHPPSGIDWSRVYTLAFELILSHCADSQTSMCAGGPPSLSFDIWIDDLHFVNR